MTSRFFSSAGMLLLALGILLQGAMVLNAEENNGDSPNYVQTEDEKDVVCLDEIGEDVETLTNDAVDFLQEHYRSRAPNSELAEGAFDKYEEYRARMTALVTQFGGAQGLQTTTAEFAEREACRVYVDSQVKTVRQLLLNHNIQTSTSKKSYTLVTKQKALNERMRELNRDFGEMYASFKVVVDKLQNTVAK